MPDHTDPAVTLLELTVAAPLAEVWRALREPEEIRRWFGWEYDGLDDEIPIVFVDEPGEEAGEEAGEQLALRWDDGRRISLADAGDATVVRVTRPAPADGTWDGAYDDIDEGWIAFVLQLRFALERHRGEDRQTVFLSGDRTTAGPPPSEALGLASDAAPAAAVRRETPAGELAGTAWYRDRWVTALTVDGYGDGLVVVVDQPASRRPPYGGGFVIVTTYGLDDAAHAEVERRWTEAWAPVAPDVGSVS